MPCPRYCSPLSCVFHQTFTLFHVNPGRMALAQLLLSLAMAPNPQDTAPTLAASTDGQVKGQGFLGFGSGPSSLNSGSCCGSQVNHEDFKKIKQCGVHWTSRRRPEMFGPTVTAHHYDILDDDAQKVTNGPCIPKDECIKEMAHADVVPCSTATGEFCKKNEYFTGGIHNRCVEIAPGPGECGDDSSQETYGPADAYRLPLLSPVPLASPYCPPLHPDPDRTRRIVRPSKENLVNSGYPSERAGDCCGRGLVHEEDLYKLAVANSVTDRQVYTLFGTPYVEANKQDYFGVRTPPRNEPAARLVSVCWLAFD